MLKYINILVILFSLSAFSAGQQGLDDLGASIEYRVKESLKPLENLGARISQNVNGQLAGLENLGQQIEQQVYQGLEPVRIMESVFKVIFGTDGTTVATFTPGGAQLIIQNGKYYGCGGTINDSNGKCTEALKLFQFQKKEDFCLVTSKSAINEWYCIVPNSNFNSINYINGRIVCETQDNSPKLLIKINEFENMCKGLASSVNYKYFTNSPLKHVGNGLACFGTGPQVCTYSQILINA